MLCRKRGYATEQEAIEELIACLRRGLRGDRSRRECNVYLCEVCDEWHLTSWVAPDEGRVPLSPAAARRARQRRRRRERERERARG